MSLLKYSIFVFLGAVSYGTLSTIVKVGLGDGFTIKELVGSQYFFGWCMVLVLMLLFSRRKVGVKRIFPMIMIGFPTALTGIFYGIAVENLPASIAVVFLFQFTWIGILIEAIMDRKFPSREKWISVIVLFIGTFLAGGIFEAGYSAISVKGMIFGVLSAFTFAIYMFVNSKIGTDVPVISKSFFMSSGALLLILITYSPSFIVSGAIQHGLWKYGLLLGLLGIIIPMIFFAIGVPKIGPGMSTILGAAELPAAVVISVLVLSEHVTNLQWFGIVIILIGIVIPQISMAIRKPQPQLIKSLDA